MNVFPADLYNLNVNSIDIDQFNDAYQYYTLKNTVKKYISITG